MNKLYSPESIIDFGNHKGDRMFMIYRYQITYLEWIIRKTDICFKDLTDFYHYGKIKKINPSISENKKSLISKEMLNNPFVDDHNRIKMMTIQNLNNLIENRHLTKDDFIDNDYHFSKELYMLNAEKYKNSIESLRKPITENKYNHNFFYED